MLWKIIIARYDFNFRSINDIVYKLEDKKKRRKKCNQTKGFLLICNADTADDQCDDETDYGNTAPADD